MRKIQSRWMLGMLVCALSGAWGQDSSTPTPDAARQSASQDPAPAYGQETAPAPVSENPPLSGLDLPSLEPHAAPLSYLQPGATFSESAESNAGSTVGGGGVSSVSRAVGSLMMKRLWRNYDLALDYVGGAGYYSLSGQGFVSLQQLDLDQKITWRRGQLSLRDSFSYLPEGNFGGAYGSTGSQGLESLGNTAFGGFWGGSSLGNLGIAPRILNVSLADVSQNLSPRSAVTAAGGYAFSHFYGTDAAGTSFIGSSQTSAQVGYNRQTSKFTQIALVYGYQGFDFSVAATAFHTHIVQGMYGHRISGRMDFLIGVGPQITFINSQSAVCSDPAIPLLLCTAFRGIIGSVNDKSTKFGVAGQARLRYKFPKTSLDLSYQRFQTSGSGLFAGSQSDIVQLTASRPLSRVWMGFADIGYSRNSRLQPLTVQQVRQCTNFPSSKPQNPCPANNANRYSYSFVGFGVHRAFGRDFHGFASYQFNELSFDQSYCVANSPCNRISNRNLVTFGLDWTPRPMRID
jgi:hypothetical protein